MRRRLRSETGRMRRPRGSRRRAARATRAALHGGDGDGLRRASTHGMRPTRDRCAARIGAPCPRRRCAPPMASYGRRCAGRLQRPSRRIARVAPAGRNAAPRFFLVAAQASDARRCRTALERSTLSYNRAMDPSRLAAAACAVALHAAVIAAVLGFADAPPIQAVQPIEVALIAPSSSTADAPSADEGATQGPPAPSPTPAASTPPSAEASVAGAAPVEPPTVEPPPVEPPPV